MAMEMRAWEAEREYYRERSQAHASRWPGAPFASGYAEAPSKSGSRALGPAVAVPEALSRNLYPPQQATTTTAVMSGAGGQHERKPWLKPVSSLLRGIHQPRRGAVQQDYLGGVGGNVLSRYPSVPSVHMVPPVDKKTSQFPVRRETSEASNNHNSSIHRHLHGDASMTVSRGPFSYEGRSMVIAAPRASYLSVGRDRARSVSPRIVRAEDVMVLGISSDDRITGTSSKAANDQQLYLPSPTKRHHTEIRLPPAAVRPTGGHGIVPQLRGSNDAGSIQGSFEPLGDGVRANDNFNCCVGQPSQLSLAVAVPPEAENYYEPPPPAVAMVAAPLCGSAGDPPTGQRKEQCVFDGCAKRSTHARRGQKPSFCQDHRAGGMVDVSRRNRCLRPGCTKPPRYALPGHKAEYCSQHKMENYVDVKHPRCECELGCVRQPTFGWEGEKARFCSAHKIDGMLDVKNPRCAEPGCMKRPRYGDAGERARFCAVHKFDDMVDLATRRVSKCNSPTKRSRDGPRSFAHDSAAASSGSRRSSMPSFNLGTSGSAPAPKRGHTPAHAGGHRRATSESWIDFCPKRVYDTSIKSGTESTFARSGHISKINDAKERNRTGALPGTVGNGPGGGSGDGGVAAGSVNTGAIANESSTGLPTPISPPPASLPSRSASSTSVVSSSSSGTEPPAKSHRFDALDYEASAILLECRSGALLSRD